MSRAASLFAVSAALVLAGCGGEEQQPPRDVSSRDLQEEVGEALDAARSFAEQGIEQFKAETELSLAELERGIERASEQSEQASEEAQRQTRDGLERAREKADELRDQLGELGEGAAENWREVARELGRALAELEEELAQTVSRMGEDRPKDE
jgi:DNA anti-recombination protein RmuC